MKQLIKGISYKVLVTSMITIALVFFCVSSVSEAKLKLKEGEFYYSGTQEGTYKMEGSFWDQLLDTLATVANYLLGIITLGFRGVAVGWIELMEILLTALLGGESNIFAYFEEAISGMESYTQKIVNIEKILFNKVEILDANIFKN